MKCWSILIMAAPSTNTKGAMITRCSKPGPLRGKSSDCPEDRHFCTLKNTLIRSLRGFTSSAKIRACEGSVLVHMRAAIKHAGVGWCILGRRYAHPRSVENQWQCLALLKRKILYPNPWTSGTFSCHKIFYIMDNVFFLRTARKVLLRISVVMDSLAK